MDRLICSACKSKYPLDDPRWRCDCGSPLDLAFEPSFDSDRVAARKQTMWRYREAIPIQDDARIVSFEEGFTPLMDVDFEGRTVFVKVDHKFPTGSFKDRGASVLVSRINELGVKEVVEDSSGNAGTAVAAYCKKAGIRCTIYVPKGTTPGKLETIRHHGATLIEVPGSREDTAKEALEAAKRTFYASHVWNPFFLHGTKTFAFEVSEQLGWKAPDTLILPVGNGTLLLGAYIGFGELMRAGIVERIPRLIAVQAEACAPLHRAFKGNVREVPEVDRKATLAEGIAIAKPARGPQILEAVRNTNGDFIVVTDDEIRESQENMRRHGFDIEPTAAATTAGVAKYLKRAIPDEIIVSVFTGSNERG
jgi:threonine synthase